jgi:glycine/D-amino acid oxidase-like deaminating enzyme
MDLNGGYPFWLIKNGLPYSYQKLETDEKVQVIILGGGISGALVAYHLIQAGIDCILIDRRTIGLGSTCGSTSLLQYELDTSLSELQEKIGSQKAVRSYELCGLSIFKLASIAQKIGFGEFYFRNSLYYAAYKKDIAFLKKEFDCRKANHFEVEFLSEKILKEEYAFNAPAAILSAMGAQTNAYNFTHSLLQYCIQKGMKIYDRSPVKKIIHHKSSVSVFTENGSRIAAKKIVYATGYESVNFINKNLVDLHSTFACASEQTGSNGSLWKDEVLLWSTADPYLYLRTTADKRIIIGGRDEKFLNAAKRDKFLPRKTKLLVQDFKKLFPATEFVPEFSWAGTFGSIKDSLPYIGNYKKLPNSLFALGFGGNGITFSLIVAEILCDIITGKLNKDAAIFSFER